MSRKPDQATHPPMGEAQAWREAMRAQGRTAGALFIAVALLSVPGALLIEPTVPLSLLALLAGALAVGLVCLILPWERMSRLWLQGLGILATVGVTAATAIDDSYVFLFLFVAIYAAYIARGRVELSIQLVAISAGLLAPVAYDPDATRDAVQAALLRIPALSLLAFAVMFVRERLEADRRAYRRFAEEALTLVARIRGKEMPLDPAGYTSPSLISMPPLPRIPAGWPRVAVGALAAVVAVPTISASLAAAGVRLPEPVRESFAEVGVTLPNQEDPAPVLAAGPFPREATQPPPLSDPGDTEERGGDKPAERDENREGHRDAQSQAGVADRDASPAPSAAAPGYSPSGTPGAPAPAAPPVAGTPQRPGGGSPPQRNLRDVVDDTLRRTLDPVNRLLDGLLNRR